MKKLTVAARWFVGLAVLGFVGWSLDFGNVFQAILACDFRWLLVGFLLTVTARVINALQLAVAIRHHGIPLTVWRSFEVNTISAFYSLFLPGQVASGAVKWYKLSKDSGRRAEVFATVFFVRVINTLFSVLIGTIAIFSDNTLGLFDLSWIGVAVVLAILIAVLIGFHDQTAERAGSWRYWSSIKAGSRIRGVLEKILRAFGEFKSLDRSQIIKLLMVPVVTQLLGGLVYLTAARALGLDIRYITLLWVTSLVYLINLIPVTISGLGIREGALVFLLPKYGISEPEALAFSLLLFGLTLSLGLLGGLLELWEVLLRPLLHRGTNSPADPPTRSHDR